jgi:tetratricopeptide (TPR) repeat protein
LVKDSVDTQTRQALKKQDPLVHVTEAGAEWLQLNRETAIRSAIIGVVVILLIVGGVVFYTQRSAAAENAFGSAMNTYATPIANPAQPAPPGTKTFASAEERAKVSNPLFLDVANHYGLTSAGHDALYFAGLTYADMGQTAQAETYLKKAIGSAGSNVSSLAKLALANLYAQSGRNADAIKLLQELVKKPTDAVPVGSSQLTLAALYQTTDPAAAHQIYAVLKDKDTTTAAGAIAAQKLAGK